ncbi:hypothetical protein [Cellulosimicrobium sp. SL-1]|uniref:hypothetical protein n=1 Tax=Cellulosimicrobium sp. SL-1 TaxID=2699423 RepID=UPI0013D8D504|nr:hypothetical protein [Cellulosimicrobium sp. SL-1]
MANIPTGGIEVKEERWATWTGRTWQVAGFGVAVPGATPEHRTLDGGGLLTELRVGGDLVAVVGLGATRELHALRRDLRRP